ncbi:NAD(P)/FAD-dependent oxidoreductase [Pseudooceanicola sp. CBS1P-1]|uniref:SidA/IucD/PvdA family monooxygenase n=1 Tax=Pseudooceanicola albus TaxID=2692189 RepID=A0A6L7G4E5_9RHOB|nr:MULTISPECIES: NAD(P)/FAD-dependent oxidoreductase [Pseudooceanicola]MBT9385412.1 NAD(P)/FAD-dependent oxidoreductase [Pseudooceanicola endophyticus]MXN18729.1 SidA/IucD/PvdA family monooxygenase [Pseudooceanicola albus]
MSTFAQAPSPLPPLSQWDVSARDAVADTGLPALEAALRDELQRLCLPRPAWGLPAPDPEMLDVLVIGAGQFGIGAAAALRLNGITNFLVLDRAEPGQEGPWVTYARMPTLRSPKYHPGLCFGVPALTFQSWYRAAHGEAAWHGLYKIPNAVWHGYISWVRDVLALPVRSRSEAVDLQPRTDHVEVVLADGARLRARRVVIANGRAGAGGWAKIPGVSEDLWPDLAAHTAEEIDFAALKGKRIAVIGTGSSAWDNAATALETGARSVDMFARRKVVPQLNKGRASSGIAFLDGWIELSDAQRWELAWYMESMGAPPPHETILRTARLEGFATHFDCGAIRAERRDGQVAIETEKGPSGDFDFLILGSGFCIDLSRDPLYATILEDITLWEDRYAPPAGLEKPAMGRQPYIGPHFELIGKGAQPLDRIYMCNASTFVSAGTMTSDVPSLDVAPARLATGIVKALFAEDFDRYFERLQDWEEEHEMKPTPFYAPEYVNKTAR